MGGAQGKEAFRTAVLDLVNNQQVRETHAPRYLQPFNACRLATRFVRIYIRVMCTYTCVHMYMYICMYIHVLHVHVHVEGHKGHSPAFVPSLPLPPSPTHNSPSLFPSLSPSVPLSPPSPSLHPLPPPSQSITTLDDSFWDRYWADTSLTAYDYFALISAVDIRNLRDQASGNLTALCFKVQ